MIPYNMSRFGSNTNKINSKAIRGAVLDVSNSKDRRAFVYPTITHFYITLSSNEREF